MKIRELKQRSQLVRKKKSSFFRQINSFTKEVTEELISRKFFERDRVFNFIVSFQTVLCFFIFFRENVFQFFRESDYILLMKMFPLDISI